MIEQERVTTGLAVPAMLNFMLAAGKPEAHDLSSLRWLMSGAAPVPPALIERYAALGIEIHQVYGLTETCGPACLISPEAALAKVGSTGTRVLPHRRARGRRRPAATSRPGRWARCSSAART